MDRHLFNQEETEEEPTLSLRELEEELMNVELRSVSFDLHGTLVLPKEDWNRRIFDAFHSAMSEHGATWLLDDAVHYLGAAEAHEEVTRVAKRWYKKTYPAFLDVLGYRAADNPSIRWCAANNYALVELATGNEDPNAGLAEFIEVITGDKKSLTFEERTSLARKRHVVMGIRVHRLLSGSMPEQWYTVPEQLELLEFVKRRGIVVSIVSNGTQRSVEACAKKFFPHIPQSRVFTPATLEKAGKPSKRNASLLLYRLGASMIKEALDGKSAPDEVMKALPTGRRSVNQMKNRWRKHMLAIQKSLDQQLLECEMESLGYIRRALEQLCRKMGLPEEIGTHLFILPHEHLHVGNSDYHDTLPTIGLGLPFHSVKYAPSP